MGDGRWERGIGESDGSVERLIHRGDRDSYTIWDADAVPAADANGHIYGCMDRYGCVDTHTTYAYTYTSTYIYTLPHTYTHIAMHIHAHTRTDAHIDAYKHYSYIYMFRAVCSAGQLTNSPGQRKRSHKYA